MEQFSLRPQQESSSIEDIITSVLPQDFIDQCHDLKQISFTFKGHVDTVPSRLFTASHTFEQGQEVSHKTLLEVLHRKLQEEYGPQIPHLKSLSIDYDAIKSDGEGWAGFRASDKKFS
jgi:deoxyadenosine/deoxycytidine kinase